MSNVEMEGWKEAFAAGHRWGFQARGAAGSPGGLRVTIWSMERHGIHLNHPSYTQVPAILGWFFLREATGRWEPIGFGWEALRRTRRSVSKPQWGASYT